MTTSLHQAKISVEIEWFCRKEEYESKPEDKCMWIKMFTQQRSDSDKVQREHIRFTLHHYKTKCMNHGHRKGEKVWEKSIFNKTVAKQNPNVDKEMTMQMLEAFIMPNR